MRSGTIHLSPSQKSVSFPIVERICRKMRLGVKTRSIQVAEGSIIVDGHHRYLASLLEGVELDMVDCPLSSAKDFTYWGLVELVDEDWDTPYTIDKLNRQDAKFSGMTIERLMELIG